MSIGGLRETLVLKLRTFTIITIALSDGIAYPENIRPGIQTTPSFDPIEALSPLPFSNGRCLEQDRVELTVCIHQFETNLQPLSIS